MLEVVIIAKCIECGNKREIKANEIAPGEMPMCDKCCSVMMVDLATRAVRA